MLLGLPNLPEIAVDRQVAASGAGGSEGRVRSLCETQRRMPIHLRVLAVAVSCLAMLAGCRIDVRVDVIMDQLGAGTVTVTVQADAEVVDAAPGLATDLRTDDLAEAGWTVEGPTTTDDGGLELVLSYRFASPAEANRALAQLSGPEGPFVNPRLSRVVEGRDVTYSLDGTLVLTDGIEAFADAEVMELVGEVPYADALAEQGLTLDEVLGITLSVQLPGEVRKSTGTEVDGALTWTVPLDGSSQSLVTTSVEEGPSDTWSTVATVLLVLLALWVVVAGTFILYVVLARRRRRTRRR